ncbi:hypothetical protein ASPACDRAFT_1870539 [Aspergillus aculeatus ATCC 16872]|uniref:RING-type E3 ubiquitin transferase n=1 Tax=Aspergillus aculeatus (strain ATCC 16872 / CBS 172.66 / WB 5094) TaxID=690307 RepID=A0A1L9WSV7_ASPA1|nr:uncharacterized protein ASPACDRAFT_1870539 [Aspergillus aculeatus ATCC 16872]OJJ99349.1 hypothetical protein ASPACDRAFT_1870539 [Aspergillus aculeatus ATCC 16872]
MSDDDGIRQAILQRTLQEVAQEESENEANPCVICLEPISETAIAVPCKHANFDFLCLVSWLEQRRNCPLCKSDVSAVRYNLDSPQGTKIYHLPPAPPANTNTSSSYLPASPIHHHPARRPRRARSPANRPPLQDQPSDDPLRRRQHIYRHQLYSLRVGSNRLSQYRELTPDRFNREEELVSRARKWIRRELKVFAFLNPSSELSAAEHNEGIGRGAGELRSTAQRQQSAPPRAGQQRLENRRGNNAEFLLEYIIAILRTVDIKGSAGQAEELLRDFLGRENARLFLHELQAWLRSPYTSLEDWDRHVQYEDVSRREGASSAQARAEGASASTPVYRGGTSHHYGGGGRGRGRGRGRVAKPAHSRRQPYQRESQAEQARRVQYARERYIPD